MRTTKTEDLVKFGPKGGGDMEEITFYVALFKDGAMLRVQIFHTKTRLDLEKKIRSYIDVQWPADKDKISWQIR